MKKTKLLLVNTILTKDYGEPVSILFLASYLRSEGHYVRIYDPQIYGDENLKQLEEICKQDSYDFVGISVLTSSDESIEIVKRMAIAIRRILPRTIIGCGGVGASLRYRDFLDIPDVDLIVLGEGEHTVTELAEKISVGENDYCKIPGIATKENPEYEKRQLISDLDSLPFMARDTLDERIKGLDQSLIDQFELRIFCGRGCFGSCTFCANYTFANLCQGERCRQRSVDNLVEEMEMLHQKYGVVRFSFWDDNFLPIGQEGLNKAKSIQKAFQKLSFCPVFGIQTRVDTITEEIIDILQRAGLQNVYLGVENINENELRILGKQVSPEQIKNALRILYQYGYSYQSESPYRLRIGYIAFTPYSTVQSIKDNLKFINEFRIPINKLMKNLLVFHGTPIKTLVQRDGLMGENFAWKFNKPGVEQLYHAIRLVIKRYLLWYEKIRYISKIAKYSSYELDWNFVCEIKDQLSTETRYRLGNICDAMVDDNTCEDCVDEMVRKSIQAIDAIAQRYSIEKYCGDFLTDHSDMVARFEKASYVFFD